MNQQTKMFLHFLTWCVKSILINIKNFFLGFLYIRKYVIAYVKGTCDGFRQSFAMGLIGYMLSLMVILGMCSAIDILMYGVKTIEFLSSANSPAYIVALCINTVFHFCCFAYSLYERFLDDYAATWNILKDKE